MGGAGFFLSGGGEVPSYLKSTAAKEGKAGEKRSGKEDNVLRTHRGSKEGAVRSEGGLRGEAGVRSEGWVRSEAKRENSVRSEAEGWGSSAADSVASRPRALSRQDTLSERISNFMESVSRAFIGADKIEEDGVEAHRALVGREVEGSHDKSVRPHDKPLVSFDKSLGSLDKPTGPLDKSLGSFDKLVGSHDTSVDPSLFATVPEEPAENESEPATAKPKIKRSNSSSRCKPPRLDSVRCASSKLRLDSARPACPKTSLDSARGASCKAKLDTSKPRSMSKCSDAGGMRSKTVRHASQQDTSRI
ncbi:MAG: hypothetical protein SGPRY_011305 [Prymnesium sp.]